MANRIKDDANSRGGSPMGSLSTSPNDRGGFGAEKDQKGAGGLSPGFRAAVHRASPPLTKKMDFSGSTFNKPNQFAQGRQRHGAHIGHKGLTITPSKQEDCDNML